jgi:preprotein translocase subunit SecB
MDFLKTVKFMGLGLDSSSTNVNRVALASARSAGQTIETSFGVEYTILNQSSDNFVIGASFTIKRQVEGATEPVVAISASYSALFGSDKEILHENVQRFSQRESKLIFWPYLRFLITDISARMSIDQIVLPLTSEFETKQVAAK